MSAAGPAGTGSAADIASEVRQGRRTATAVLDEHLGRIAEGEADVHAFNLVMEDQSRLRAAEIDRMVAAGGDPGPLPVCRSH